MIRRFFVALQFLTRLPVPRTLNSSETDIGKAAAFFPLVGVIVGALVCNDPDESWPSKAAERGGTERATEYAELKP